MLLNVSFKDTFIPWIDLWTEGHYVEKDYMEYDLKIASSKELRL